MNKTMKERAKDLTKTHYKVLNPHQFAHFVEDIYKFVDEIANAPEPEPFAVIHLDGSFVHVEFKQPIAGTGKFEVYAAPQDAEPPADVARDAEPVGYLYTHVQSGEYHVSDYDDDYRGPERAMWCIEPVYRRTKG